MNDVFKEFWRDFLEGLIVFGPLALVFAVVIYRIAAVSNLGYL